MTDASLESAHPAEPMQPAAEPMGLVARLSDLLNPILVREVQQALKGRLFVLSVAVALIFSIALATHVASVGEGMSAAGGRQAFSYGLMALVPLVLFVVPLQGFQSMRVELRAGISEQLLLSRLRPLRIVTGKLAAALVQFILYLAVLAPVLSMTYLLRGVDVPTIIVCLGFSMLFCVTATALAIAAAAQGVIPALQPLANIGVAFGLGMLTIGMMASIGDGNMVGSLTQVMREPEWAMVVSGITLGCLAGTVLAALVGASLLAHSYENRSTSFRLYLVGIGAAFYVWLAYYLPPSRHLSAVLSSVICLVIGGGVFGLFFVTEPAALSPRHRALLPRSKALRLLMLPLLPGRDRGMLFTLLLFAGLWLVMWLVWPQVPAGASAAARRAAYGFDNPDDLWRMIGFLAIYVLIFLMLTKLTRDLLPELPRSGHAARVMLLLLLLCCTVLPMLFDVLVAGRVAGWHPGHVLNPFWTSNEFVYQGGSRGWDVLLGLSIFAGLLLLLNLRGLLRCVTEVLHARAHRDEEPSAAS